MLNMLRMDIRRMVKGKSLYVCLGILLFTTVLAFGLMYVVLNPDARELAVNMGLRLEVGGESLDSAAAGAMEELAGTTGVLDMFRQTNIKGGLFAVVAGILAAVFVCSDFESGFAKNIFSIHEKKWKFICSKLLMMAIVNLFYLLVTFLVTLLLNAATGGFFAWNAPGSCLFYLAGIWVLMNGMSALMIFISATFRSKAAGCTAAVIIGAGFISMIAGAVFSLIGTQWLQDYFLFSSIENYPLAYGGVGDLLPAAVGAAHIILWTVLGSIILSKKDI